MPNIATVCSSHGLGHLTRQIALGEELDRAGSAPTFFTSGPADLVTQSIPSATVVSTEVDVGIAQFDSITEDIPRTIQLLEERCSQHRIETLASQLSTFDLVIVDCAPPALKACQIAGVPAVAMGNFDWSWIYRHYAALQEWSERFAEWQRPHPAIFLSPGPGMHGFRQVENGGLLGRMAPAINKSTISRSRSDQPTADPCHVLVSFGGFGLADVDTLLPAVDGVTWVFSPPMDCPNRTDCVLAPDVPYPSLVAACDLVLTKPGYSIFAEAALAGTRLLWIPRGDFPEARWLETAMKTRGDIALATSPKEPKNFQIELEQRIRQTRGQTGPLPVTSTAAHQLAVRLLRWTEV